MSAKARKLQCGIFRVTWAWLGMEWAVVAHHPSGSTTNYMLIAKKHVRKHPVAWHSTVTSRFTIKSRTVGDICLAHRPRVVLACCGIETNVCQVIESIHRNSGIFATIQAQGCLLIASDTHRSMSSTATYPDRRGNRGVPPLAPIKPRCEPAECCLVYMEHRPSLTNNL
jgi:hypothetical protein